jgi:hypothetical protein
MPKHFEEPDLDAFEDLDDGLSFSDEADDYEEYNADQLDTLGIDPERPCRARPGSEAKVKTLSARYAAGLPLWHEEDCYEHGPRESDLRIRDISR